MSYSINQRSERLNDKVMNIRNTISKSIIGKKILEDVRYRTVLSAICGLVFNLLYAAYNGVLGYITSSYWFISMCAYHIILSIMRFSAILNERKNNIKKEYAVMRFTGILLLILSMVLSGIVYMCVSLDIAAKYGEIIMITIATYTFYKITMAVIRTVKYRKENSPIMSAIRGIGYAEISVSVLTMQMSMLISFEKEMSSQDIYILNLLTGIGVCLFTLVLGIIMIKNSNKKRRSK